MKKQAKKPPTIDRRSWEEFRTSGLLWFANTILHVFGWAIVFHVADETDKLWKPGTIMEVYPARVRFRGFVSDINDTGHRALAAYMVKNAKALKEEADG